MNKSTSYLPNDLYFGYYAGGISKKDLIEYLKNKAYEHIQPVDNARFFFKKFNDGFIWEIHDGGNAQGLSSFIIDKLEKDASCYFESNGKHYIAKLNQDNGHVSFIRGSAATFKDCKFDASEPEYSDPVRPFVKRGSGLFVASVIFFVVSCISLPVSIYVADNKKNHIEQSDLGKSVRNIPLNQVAKIKEYQKNELTGKYIYQITYNGKRWNVSESDTENYNEIRSKVLLKLGKDIVSDSPTPPAFPEVSNNLSKEDKNILKKKAMSKLLNSEMQ